MLAAERKQGSKSAHTAGPERLDVGDTFSLGDRRWIVVGVLKSAGSTSDSEIWAKRGMVGPMFGKDTYSSLVLRTAGPDAARRLKKFFNTEYKKAAVLRRSRPITSTTSRGRIGSSCLRLGSSRS